MNLEFEENVVVYINLICFVWKGFFGFVNDIIFFVVRYIVKFYSKGFNLIFC